MKQRKGWTNNRAQLLADRASSDARTVGDAYLRYWAAWATADPCKPRLAQMKVQYGDNYADEQVKLRPINERGFVENLAADINAIVERLPSDEKEAVLAYYCRIRIKVYSHTRVIEHIRAWQPEAIADKIGIGRSTMYRRLTSARSIVEAEAERMDLLPPPHA